MDKSAQRLLIRIEATTAQLRAELAKGEGQLDRSATAMERRLDVMRSRINEWHRGVTAKLAGVFTLAGIGLFVRQVSQTSAEFQRLDSSLQTVTGSSAAAQAAFAWISKFAAETPFDLQQVVEAFIKLKALGLEASEPALRSFGNTASAMGKSLNDFIEAVADAATGEFERLKEFGIVARTQGDQVTFTFQGVQTKVQKNAQAITGYLRKIGDVNFAGAMEKQSATLGGALSNAGDAWTSFVNKVGEGGLADAIEDVARRFSTLAGESDGLASALGGTLGAIVRGLADAFEFLARNMALVQTAAGALLGMQLGSYFGPWGAAIGLAAGAALGLGSSLLTASNEMATLKDESDGAARGLVEIARQADGAAGKIYGIAVSARTAVREILSLRAEQLFVDYNRAQQERQSFIRGQIKQRGDQGFSGEGATPDEANLQISMINKQYGGLGTRGAQLALESLSKQYAPDIFEAGKQLNSLMNAEIDIGNQLAEVTRHRTTMSTSIESATVTPAATGTGGGGGSGGGGGGGSGSGNDKFGDSVQDLQAKIREQQLLALAYTKGSGAVVQARREIERLNDIEKVSKDFTGQRRDALVALTNTLHDYKAANDNAAVVMGVQQDLDRNLERARLELEMQGRSNVELQTEIQLLEIRNQLRDAGVPDAAGQAETFRASITEGLRLNEVLERQKATAEELAGIFDQAFDRIGSAITEAFVTGQGAAVDFASVVDGVVSELIQSLAKLAIMNPLKNFLFGGSNGQALPTILDAGGFLGSLFGGGSSAPGIGAAGTGGSMAAAYGSSSGGGWMDSLFSSIGSFVGSIFHTGGIVGGSSAGRRVGMSAFAGAPRFHGGGLAGLASDEVAAILRRGEEVLPQSDPRHLFNLPRLPQFAGVAANNSGPVTNNYKVVNNGQTQMEASRTEEQQNSSGGRDVTIYLDEIVGRKLATRGTASNRALRQAGGSMPLRGR